MHPAPRHNRSGSAATVQSARLPHHFSLNSVSSVRPAAESNPRQLSSQFHFLFKFGGWRQNLIFFFFLPAGGGTVQSSSPTH
jgi:hypothetical protein